MYRRLSSLFVFVGALTVAFPGVAAPHIFSVEGVSGDIDLKDRNPSMTFSKEILGDVSRILVDASVKNEGYQKYPIRFEFFVNNALVATQIRSTELPGPIGITLPLSQYPLPYNYTIVATLMTPNRTFTTTTYGSVDGTELSARLACTLTIAADGEDAPGYSAEEVLISEVSDNALQLSFTGTSGDTSKEVSLALSLAETSVSGTLSIDGTGVTVSGEASFKGGNLVSLEVASSSGTSTVSCD